MSCLLPTWRQSIRCRGASQARWTLRSGTRGLDIDNPSDGGRVFRFAIHPEGRRSPSPTSSCYRVHNRSNGLSQASFDILFFSVRNGQPSNSCGRQPHPILPTQRQTASPVYRPVGRVQKLSQVVGGSGEESRMSASMGKEVSFMTDQVQQTSSTLRTTCQPRPRRHHQCYDGPCLRNLPMCPLSFKDFSHLMSYFGSVYPNPRYRYAAGPR